MRKNTDCELPSDHEIGGTAYPNEWYSTRDVSARCRCRRSGLAIRRANRLILDCEQTIEDRVIALRSDLAIDHHNHAVTAIGGAPDEGRVTGHVSGMTEYGSAGRFVSVDAQSAGVGARSGRSSGTWDESSRIGQDLWIE